MMEIEIRSNPSNRNEGIYALVLDEIATPFAPAPAPVEDGAGGRGSSCAGSSGAGEGEVDKGIAGEVDEGMEGKGISNDTLLEDGEVSLPRQDHEAPDGQIARVSISHDAGYATAVCLAVESTGFR